MSEPTVAIMLANVLLDDGTVVANIEAITVGGGLRIVGNVKGEDITEADPTFHRWHARLLSPDRMIADQLFDAESYEEAVAIGLKYAAKRMEHAETIAALGEGLKL